MQLSTADFDLLAELLEGYEAEWPLAVVFAAQAAYEQGLDTAPWVARAEQALRCSIEDDRGACSRAIDAWRGLRPLMAPPTHWIEAIGAAARSCAAPPARLVAGTHRASGRYRGTWALRAHEAVDQPYFDCVVGAIALPADEGQHVHVDVFVIAPRADAAPSAREASASLR